MSIVKLNNAGSMLAFYGLIHLYYIIIVNNIYSIDEQNKQDNSQRCLKPTLLLEIWFYQDQHIGN